MSNKIDIWVFADWIGLTEAKCIGILSAQTTKGRKSFSFSYNEDWLASNKQMILDPDISWFKGGQYPYNKENFGMFTDSMPDTWGRTLMKRREIQKAKAENRSVKTLYELDFLLGVQDESRMGALRYKLDPNGPFLDNDPISPTPPWTSIREMQYGINKLESNIDNDETNKWLNVLMAPGSSLGGARPKANVLDEDGNIWIAKFPSKNDDIDKAAWEYLAYKLALESGVIMSECRIEKVSGEFHTFFTKRFDRKKSKRIHFSSAMTMIGKNEDLIRDNVPSYLDLVEFIQFSCVNIDEDLSQLWRRIIFNIFISNTDDHLRNHGFILTASGWILSPAYDLNPSIDKDGLSLNIDSDNNDLSLELAKSVGIYFRLNEEKMNQIIDEVKSAVSSWKEIAKQIGISRQQQLYMEKAFKI